MNDNSAVSDNKNNVLVSIIIPAYNTGEYIHRAIESSLRQTHSNVEIIVVDDGSKDNTLEVAQSYAGRDSRVKVLHKENGGVSSARNLGIREAHGEYVTFLDSDDWFEDFAIDTLLEAQINHPNKFISAGLYSVRYDASENVFRRNVYTNEKESRDLTVEETLAVISDIHFYFLHSKMFIANLIRKHKLHFHEDTHYGEDLVFNFEYLCKTGGLYYIGKPILNILSRSDSAMNVPYEQRRIFVDGKLNDYLQVMVENPGNTHEMTRLMKIHHTRRLAFELRLAFERGADEAKIKQVRDAARMYMKEYLKADTVSLVRKFYFLLVAYLPVPLSKLIFIPAIYVNDLIKTVKIRSREEVIPYW